MLHCAQQAYSGVYTYTMRPSTETNRNSTWAWSFSLTLGVTNPPDKTHREVELLMKCLRFSCFLSFDPQISSPQRGSPFAHPTWTAQLLTESKTCWLDDIHRQKMTRGSGFQFEVIREATWRLSGDLLRNVTMLTQLPKQFRWFWAETELLAVTADYWIHQLFILSVKPNNISKNPRWHF